MTVDDAESVTPSGIVMIDERGSIRFATPASDLWLDRLGPRDGALPVPVWAAMAAQRQAAPGEARLVSVETAHGIIRVEASAAGEPGVQAVVLSTAPRMTGPAIPDGWGLTARESDVVRQLALGKSNAQIAGSLFVEASTVEWHLRQVYEKVGVKGRQEVLAALFRQTVLPSIERVASREIA
jgi:DNA-binding CsgD family transcriptional regulator